MKTNHRSLVAYRVVVAAALICLGAGSADADIIFERVADTDTLVPGGSGTFSDFGHHPAICNGRVVFSHNRPVYGGIYAYDGGQLSVVADTNTPVPGGTGSFSSFSHVPSIDASGNVAFRAGASGGMSGVYAQLGGTLGVVADTSTLIPGGTGAFTGFGDQSMDNGQLAFSGTGAGHGGIYTAAGGITVVADTNTPIPGGSGNFTSLTAPSFDGGQVAFHGTGTDGQQGIFTDIGGLNVVADTTTPIPSGPGTFQWLSDPSINEGSVAFVGGELWDSPPPLPHQGVFTEIGGELSVVADTSMPVPGTGNPFLLFMDASLDDGKLAFLGGELTQVEPPYYFGRQGIYFQDGQSLIEIISGGDSLDGKTVQHLFAGTESLSGDQVAFYASFQEGGAGIYVATVPEPTTALLLLLTAPAVLRRRR